MKCLMYKGALYVSADSGAVELQTEMFEQHKAIQLEETFNSLVEMLPSGVRKRPEIMRAVRTVQTQIEGIKSMVSGNPDPEDADVALEHYVEDSGPEAGMGVDPNGVDDDGAASIMDDVDGGTDVPADDD